MQCGAGARPEWIGKRLVAVKRMKRVWEGGWQQASKLGELVVGFFSHVHMLDLIDLCIDSRFVNLGRIRQSFPFTTHFCCQTRKSFTLCLSVWKETCIS